MAPKVSVVGSYGVGLTFGLQRFPAAGETVLCRYHRVEHGGKGSNQSVAAARLGAEVRLRTALGDDAFADKANQLWQEEGVEARVVVRSGEPTMTGAVLVEQGGDNRIVVAPGALAGLAPEHIEPCDVAGSDVLLVQLEIPLPAARRALELAASEGVRSILNPAPVPDATAEELAELLALADIITPNVTEARSLLGRGEEAGPAELASSLAATGRSVVVTAGPHGAFVASDGAVTHVEACPVREVVDSTGAGDTFTAALGVAVGEGATLVEAARFASVAAAHCVSVAGVLPSLPNRRQLREPELPAALEVRS
jgi:ribokinase